jgi:hypothetical protein
MEVVFVDEFVLEDADFGYLGMRVLIEVLKDGFVDLSVGELLLSFVLEYFVEVFASDLDSEVVLLEGDGHD